MKSLFEYIRYFFYLGINWNFRLAWFIVARELKGEKKYRIDTIGIDDLSDSVSKEDIEHASIYQPVNYYTAETLFEYLTKDDLSGIFLDVGCGKGRTLAMAAYYGFKEIIGIDFSPKLCHQAVAIAGEIEANYPATAVSIECVDARDYEIPDAVSVIFLFNPFDDLVMKDFLKQVKASLQRQPRPVKILYANPQCSKLLLNAGFVESGAFRRMKYLEGAVFTIA